MLELVVNVIEQGLIFGLLSLGVFITYKILDFPDLSVDGTIVLGGGIAAVLIVNEVNPIIATGIAFIGGSIAGLFTGILHVHLKISNLLSGILVMISLYSINLRIIGASNISLLNETTIYDTLGTFIVISLFVIGVKILLDTFLKTKLGMLLRITGDNANLVTSLGQNIGSMKILGLMISNGIVALSGALLSQYQGFLDISSGTGTIVIGLASVIIGETIFKFKFFKLTTMVILGSVLYTGFQAFTLNLGFAPSDFKLISAVIVTIALGLNNYKGLFNLKEKLNKKVG